MCRIRAFPRVHCFSYLFFSSVALPKSYCCLYTGVEERLCARGERTCVRVCVGVFVRVHVCAYGCTCVCALKWARERVSERVCMCVPVLVLSSRFVNYIGPDQTSYIYTHSFYSLLNSSLFFFFYCIFFTYKRTKRTHSYVYIYVCIRLHFSERLLSKCRLRSVSHFIFHRRRPV